MNPTKYKKLKETYQKSGIGSSKHFSDTINQVAERELVKKRNSKT